jgi:hypothetical protein
MYDFNSLHWAAAFVGFEEMHMVGGAVLMTLETFASPILFTLSLPMLVIWISPHLQRYCMSITSNSLREIVLSGQLFFKPFLIFMFFFSLNATLTTIFVYLQVFPLLYDNYRGGI